MTGRYTAGRAKGRRGRASASRDASRSSPARGAGIGRAYARLLADRGASVVVNDLGGSMRGRRRGRRDRRPRSPPRSSRPAATAIADTERRGHAGGRRALVDAAVAQFGRRRHPDQQRRHHALGRLPRSRRGQPRAAPRGPRRRLVQHHPRGVAAPGRAGLRPDRDDDVLGDVRPAQEPLVRHRQGRRHRAHPQPRDRRRPRTASRSTSSPRGDDAHGGPIGRATQSPRPRCRPTSSHRWSRSSPTRTARSAARSTPPAPAASRASSSPRPRDTSRRTARRPSRTSPQHWAAINDESGYSVPVDLGDWSATFTSHLDSG